jgi:hypothetical protein
MNQEQIKPKIVEHPALDESTGFDYRVHIKDSKTGKLIRLQHYAKHAKGDEVMFERPIGSGNAYTPNGEPAGLWDFKQWKKLGDEHAEVAQPPANRQEELEQQNAALEAELSQLRAEAAKKAAPAQQLSQTHAQAGGQAQVQKK